MIEILNFKMVDKGALIATFDAKMLKWGGLIIGECKYFESGAKKWVQLSSREYESEGKKKYFQLIRYEDRELDSKLKETIMHEVQKMRQKGT
jgi:hypothetical protein